MEQIKLDAQIRKQAGTRNLRSLRREGFVPAIVYGEERQPTAIKVMQREFERIRRQYHGEIIFNLNVKEGEKKLRDYSAIVREEQHDPVSDRILHIDFKRINLEKELEVKVAVIAKGDPIGVKQDGGSLEHIIWELPVICLPTLIPEKLEVEVSHLKIGDSIHVRDIVLPSGVRTEQDPESVVMTVSAPHRVEEVPLEGQTPAELEVIKEKKDKVEGEEKKEDGKKAAEAPADKKKEEKKDDKKAG